ncbi:MAG: type sorting protein [Flavipsychrobacter sp.]|nr:type sorting protein [Flavipsychrobacter sp.]
MNTRHFITLLCITCICTVSSAQVSRLVATGTSRYDPLTNIYIISDTTTYQYLMQGGYDEKNDLLKFSSSFDTGFYPSNKTYTVQNFDPDGNITETVHLIWFYGPWEIYSKSAYHYNTDGYIDTIDIIPQGLFSSHNKSERIIKVYNTANQPIQYIDLVYNATASTWVNNSISYYTYDPDNNITVVNRVTWDTTTNTFDTSTRTINILSGKDVITKIDQSYNITVPGGWKNDSMRINSEYNAGKPATSMLLTWNNNTSSYDTLFRNNYTYNSFNQVTTDATEYYDVGGWSPLMCKRYHYELYTASIKNASTLEGQAELYPVPASDNINIDINWAIPQAFSITISEMQGRIIDHWMEDVKSTYHHTMSVANIPAGSYIIRITGTTNKIVRRLIITAN